MACWPTRKAVHSGDAQAILHLLAERHQQFNPFKFVYDAGLELPPPQ